MVTNMSRLWESNRDMVSRLVESRGSTSFIWPGVSREPCWVHKILTTALERFHIAPLGSSMVHATTVALDATTWVYEGETWTLAAKVGVGGGSLLDDLGVDHAQEEGREEKGQDCHPVSLDWWQPTKNDGKYQDLLLLISFSGKFWRFSIKLWWWEHWPGIYYSGHLWGGRPGSHSTHTPLST